MDSKDLPTLKLSDKVNVTYTLPDWRRERSRFVKCITSVSLTGKYFFSRGYEKGIGYYIELTDGFDQGYKTNSIIIRLKRLERIEFARTEEIKRVA